MVFSIANWPKISPNFNFFQHNNNFSGFLSKNLQNFKRLTLKDMRWLFENCFCPLVDLPFWLYFAAQKTFTKPWCACGWLTVFRGGTVDQRVLQNASSKLFFILLKSVEICNCFSFFSNFLLSRKMKLCCY